jgi:hypothetical protein
VERNSWGASSVCNNSWSTVFTVTFNQNIFLMHLYASQVLRKWFEGINNIYRLHTFCIVNLVSYIYNKLLLIWLLQKNCYVCKLQFQTTLFIRNIKLPVPFLTYYILCINEISIFLKLKLLMLEFKYKQ